MSVRPTRALARPFRFPIALGLMIGLTALLIALNFLENTILPDIGGFALGADIVAVIVGISSGLRFSARGPVFNGKTINVPFPVTLWNPLGLFEIGMLTVATLVLVPFAFGQICRHLYLLFGGFSGVDKSAPIWTPDRLSNWDIFSLSWLLNNVTFNASQVFGWVSTPIQPTAWWSSMLVVVLSVVVEFILFANVLNVLRLSLIYRSVGPVS